MQWGGKFVCNNVYGVSLHNIDLPGCLDTICWDLQRHQKELSRLKEVLIGLRPDRWD